MSAVDNNRWWTMIKDKGRPAPTEPNHTYDSEYDNYFLTTSGGTSGYYIPSMGSYYTTSTDPKFSQTVFSDDWECEECSYKKNPSKVKKCNYCGKVKKVKPRVLPTVITHDLSEVCGNPECIICGPRTSRY